MQCLTAVTLMKAPELLYPCSADICYFAVDYSSNEEEDYSLSLAVEYLCNVCMQWLTDLAF